MDGDETLRMSRGVARNCDKLAASVFKKSVTYMVGDDEVGLEGLIKFLTRQIESQLESNASMKSRT